MGTALRIAACACSLAALMVIGGGHWAVLQTVAWAQMVVDYTRDSGSLRQGVVNTFDGAHPCELCRRISAGVEKEARDERQKPSREELLRKITLAAVPLVARPVPPAGLGRWLPSPAASPGGRMADAPPVPPPRLA